MRMNPNDDYRPYDWLQVLGGLAVGALFGFLTRGAGASSAVAWAVGLTIGVGATVILALLFWVERRSITGIEPSDPERIAQSLGTLWRRYRPINRVLFATAIGVLLVMLVIEAARG
jgi:hypothetical protein